MANEVLFAGGRLDSLAFITGTPVEITTAGYFDASYSDCALQLFNSDALAATFVTMSGGALTPTTVVSGETAYIHFDAYFKGLTNNVTINNVNLAELRDASGFPWFAIRNNSASGTFGLYYNSGTGASPVWTQLGSSWTPNNPVYLTHDIKLTLGSPHSIEYSQNGNLYFSGTFTQASLTAIRDAKFVGTATNTANGINFLSQILCTRGISTINAKVKTCRATGAGTNSGWTGAFGNVSEAINSDATLDTALTATLKQSYTMGDVTVPGGFVIQSIFHWLRAKDDGSAPANIQSLIRSGGTDFASSNLSGIGTSFVPIGLRYDTDPNTSAAWTQAGWNAAEAGYASAT
jgi:hypothetical protein